MYLKSIEVQGFKSFANKMKFQFHNGITGIVGPNGSGKSNVGDAVRWVLGEQSVKQLRGSSMSDVIFSGTENRKPMGFASVAITLDNSDHKLPVDYNEVTVTRRLYRSGESEYLINGSGCRLKDIKEMFYDTGIGKEGYSIIGQGQIDKILSGKPEDRRELFDEAAGIVKFKRRKLAAQKKLDEEHGNLTRINDILTEQRRQLGPLERQAEKAKIYLRKRDELKQNDVDVFALESEKMEKQLAAVEEKILISDHDMSDVERQQAKIREEYERLEKELEELNLSIEGKQENMNASVLLRGQLESQIELLKEQIRSVQQNDEHFSKRILSLEEMIQEKSDEEGKEKDNLKQIEEELSKAIVDCREQEELCNQLYRELSELEGGVAEGQADLIALLNARTSIKSKMQRYETLIEQIQIRKAVLVQQLLSSKSDQIKLEEIQEGYQKEADTVKERIEKIISDNEHLEKEIGDMSRDIVEQTRYLEELKADYHRAESRLESLRNMTERYDGYGNSIRRVMEKKKQVPGIHGVVADLIKTEKKYESAIETALGGSIQNIVTDNENTAKDMIQYLKQNKYGRATFLPLSAMKGKGGIGNEKALYEPGSIGVASVLVDVDSKYEMLIEYLLGKTLVVDHIDHAIAIAKKYHHSIRIVTLDGDLLSPGGSMSGGAYKNSSNLLGRRSELEQLKKELQEKNQSINATQKRIDEIRDHRTELRDALVRGTEAVQKEYLNQNTIRLKMEEMHSNAEKTVGDRHQIESEITELDQQMKEIADDQNVIGQEMEESKTKEEELEQNILQTQKVLEEKRKDSEEKGQQAEHFRLLTESLKQKKDFHVQNIRRITGEIASYKEEKEELSENIGNTKEETIQKEQQIQQLLVQIEVGKGEEEALQNELDALRDNRKMKNDQHKEFFQKREALSDQKSSLDKERMRLDNQKERLGDYLERQINYIWEEYELTKSQAVAMKSQEEVDLAELKKRVASIKGEIRNLGSVNVNAIEEFKEVSERHEFLSKQYTDLVEGEQALRNIIQDLDKGMRHQFKEQFEVIQREFSKSFKELFGGGKGTLELTEDEDMLEAGIRIIAQPPGKKLINMMQMSGGEKALTAIALLFAIQNMKPSPFCLLDEIEAALDENNVSRYANYLHKLTKNTQFIIITHRRGTMAVADRLYGITMQEKGISTQVSVNMVEAELDR